MIVGTNEAARGRGIKAGALAESAAAILGGGRRRQGRSRPGRRLDVSALPGGTRRGRRGDRRLTCAAVSASGSMSGVARIGVARSDLHRHPCDSGGDRAPGMTAPVVRIGEHWPSTTGVRGDCGASAVALGRLDRIHRRRAGLRGRAGAGTLGVPVRLVDERLRLVSAQSVLRENGRTTRESRWSVTRSPPLSSCRTPLDFERSADTPAGRSRGPGRRRTGMSDEPSWDDIFKPHSSRSSRRRSPRCSVPRSAFSAPPPMTSSRGARGGGGPGGRPAWRWR